jgi:hypothetical protein
MPKSAAIAIARVVKLWSSNSKIVKLIIQIHRQNATSKFISQTHYQNSWSLA